MGHTTRISDYELDRAQTRGPEAEGVDIEADREKPKPEPKTEPAVTTSKVVEPAKKAAPRKTTARAKAK